MQRRAFEDFVKWKNNPKRKPLLVSGVRQCGKTYLIKQFAEQEFEDVAYFVVEKNPAIQAIFEEDNDTTRIIDELGSIIRGKAIVPGKTRGVRDEIQACPKAIESVKYFCEEMRDLHLIAAGSLLGVAMKEKGLSFPVGKIDRIEMFPMTFDEFVIADDGEKYINGINKLKIEKEISAIYTVPREKYLKNYYIIGGMPEVVQTWIETHDYEAAEEIQKKLIKDYEDDFGKHSSNENAIKARMIWNSIPTQIAKDNNKFIFSHAKSGARAKDLEDALEWLVNAGIVYKLTKVENPEIPLAGQEDLTYFKLYMADIGLLRVRANLNYRTILFGDDGYIRFKGAMAENYIMSQFKAMKIPVYYWRTKADAEIDFLTDYEGVLTPIEVKAADNTKAKSLHLFCNRYKPKLAFKTSLKNVGDNYDGNTHVWSIPLYSIYRFKKYVFSEMNWKE